MIDDDGDDDDGDDDDGDDNGNGDDSNEVDGHDDDDDDVGGEHNGDIYVMFIMINKMIIIFWIVTALLPLSLFRFVISSP